MNTSGTINKKVVVIDDEPSVQEVVRGYLEKDGYLVYVAGNGREGLARLAIHEEREVSEQLGETWKQYASVTPRLLPRLHPSRPPVPPSVGARSAEEKAAR